MERFSDTLGRRSGVAKRLVVFLFSFILAAGISWPASAQMTGATTQAAPAGPRKSIGTIVFAGIAGSVLGLSTLSFYGRPQEHLSNILIGFAVGTIAGTVYTTYRAATQPESLYTQNKSSGPELWAAEFHARAAQPAPALQACWSWSF